MGFGVCSKPSGQDEVCVDTDENGFLYFEELSPANTQVFIKSNDPNFDVPEQAFRYLSLSVEKFRPISDSISIKIQGDTTQEWGLNREYCNMDRFESFPCWKFDHISKASLPSLAWMFSLSYSYPEECLTDYLVTLALRC